MDEQIARERLEELRNRLQAQLSELPSRLDVGAAGELPDTGRDSGDQAQHEQATEEIEALVSDHRARIEQVDRALARLRGGTYGICRICGQAIAPGRLEARPDAETCASHAA